MNDIGAAGNAVHGGRASVQAGSLAPVEAASLSRRRARRRCPRGFGPVRVAQERLQQLQLGLLEERVPKRLNPAAAQLWRDAVAAAANVAGRRCGTGPGLSRARRKSMAAFRIDVLDASRAATCR
jgi:hypothetical protein